MSLDPGDDPAVPSQCKLVFPLRPLQLSGPFSTVQFPRPFRRCPLVYTSCGIPACEGFASLLSHLSVQQQSSPYGPGVPRAQEGALHLLLGQLVTM